jgi:hypothetical protein
MLDVPRELVRAVAKLLRAERRARGTRAGSRALTCWYQALLVLAWFRNQGNVAVGAGFGLSRATAYRYRDQVIMVLAELPPALNVGPVAAVVEDHSQTGLGSRSSGRYCTCSRMRVPSMTGSSPSWSAQQPRWVRRGWSPSQLVAVAVP